MLIEVCYFRTILDGREVGIDSLIDTGEGFASLTLPLRQIFGLLFLFLLYSARAFVLNFSVLWNRAELGDTGVCDIDLLHLLLHTPTKAYWRHSSSPS